MKVLQNMIIGIFFGLASSYTILTIVAALNEGVMYSGADMLEEYIIAIVLGAVIGIGTFIFELERIPFVAQLFIHFIYVIVCVLIAGKIGGWYVESGPLSISGVLIIVAIVYLFVWLIVYVMTNRDVEEINERIKKTKGD